MHFSLTFILPLLCHILLVSGQGNFTQVPFPLSSTIATTNVPSTPTHSHTTLIPTPTPSPTLPPQPHTPCFQYNTTNTSEVACVKMCLSQINVTFSNTIAVLVPSKTVKMVNVSGMCPAGKAPNAYNTSNITIKWLDNSGNYTLMIQFRLNLVAAKDTYYKAKDEWYISAVSFSNGTNNYSSDFTNNVTFEASKDQSYTCATPLTLKLNGNQSNTFATLRMSDYTIRAFGNFGSKNSFGSQANCVNSNEMPGYVPIIVGCALAGLVVLVLLAYAIGRCYTHKKGGYERLS